MSYNLLSDFKLEQIGSSLQPCIFCKKIITVPKFKKFFPADNKEVEFQPKPICDNCSDEKTFGDQKTNFRLRFHSALNEISKPYIITPDLKQILGKISDLIESKSVFDKSYPFIYIFGIAGSGKTIIAKSLCKIMNFKFIKSYDLFHSYKQEISGLYNGKICIDDLGKEIDGHNRKYLTYELMDNRYDNKAPTIITTQLMPEFLRDNYGDDFYYRIKQYSKFIQMPNMANWRKNDE